MARSTHLQFLIACEECVMGHSSTVANMLEILGGTFVFTMLLILNRSAHKLCMQREFFISQRSNAGNMLHILGFIVNTFPFNN